MSVNRRNILLGLGAVAAVQGGGYLLYRRVAAQRGPVSDPPFHYEPTGTAPRGLEATLESRHGPPVRLKDALGQPLLLHFWATWCEPCRTELPLLLKLSAPRTLLVSADENWQVVDHFFDGKVPTAVVLDSRGDARRAFEVGTLPDTYLLDASGRSLARFHGPRAWNSEAAASALRRLTQPRETR